MGTSFNVSTIKHPIMTWLRPFWRLISYAFSWLSHIFTAKVRILPLVIACASTLFTVKVTQLFQKTSSSESIIDFKMAEAAAPSESPEMAKSQDSSALLDKSAASAPTSAVPSSVSSTSESSSLPSVNLEEAVSKSQKKSVKFSEFDPLKMSAHEFKVLQELSNRETQLNQEENRKPVQESTLKAIEAQIQKKAETLNESQKKLEDLLNKIEVQENSNIVRLVKMAENMKAKEAAKILEGVEFDVLIEIMEKVKEAKASAILSNMDPQKASYLMTELALRKRIFKKDSVPKTELASPPANPS